MQSSADASANLSTRPALPPSLRDPAAQKPLVMCNATTNDPSQPQPSPPPLHPAPASRPPGTHRSAMGLPSSSRRPSPPPSAPPRRADCLVPPRPQWVCPPVPGTGSRWRAGLRSRCPRPVVWSAASRAPVVSVAGLLARAHTATISMIKKGLILTNARFRAWFVPVWARRSEDMSAALPRGAVAS